MEGAENYKDLHRACSVRCYLKAEYFEARSVSKGVRSFASAEHDLLAQQIQQQQQQSINEDAVQVRQLYEQQQQQHFRILNEQLRKRQEILDEQIAQQQKVLAEQVNLKDKRVSNKLRNLRAAEAYMQSALVDASAGWRTTAARLNKFIPYRL